MKESTSKIKQSCHQSFPCFYRRHDWCTFWEEADKIPAAWDKLFPDDPTCDLVAIDTFREPCLELEEKRRERCAGFIIPGEQGWLKCEECRESLCQYMEEPFRVPDMLGWLRKDST